MPIVNIDWFEGRTVEQKKEIARKITDVITDVTGCPEDAVTVIFNDKQRHDIAKAGEISTS